MSNHSQNIVYGTFELVKLGSLLSPFFCFSNILHFEIFYEIQQHQTLSGIKSWT